MEIQELIIKGFGKFENHRITLKSGVNIIYGGNETGKTTIHAFIRAMLFGLNRGRGRAARKDEYQIRQPWEHPGTFLGSMRIVEDGQIYRIDRCFDRSTQELSLVCETTAQEFARPQEMLDTLLGGISESAFVNTVFVPQMQCETDEALAEELQRYMVNSEQTMDARLDVTQALRTLRKKKKAFEQKKKKEEEAVEAQIAQKQAKAEVLRAELGLLRRQADEAKRRLSGGRAAFRADADSPEDGWTDVQQKEGSIAGRLMRGRTVLEILLFLAGVLALAGSFVLAGSMVQMFLRIFGCLFLVMILPAHLFLREGAGHPETDSAPEEADIRARLRSLTEEIRNREDAYQKLEDELERLYHSHVKMDGAETEIAAITMAIDRICELTGGIYAKSGGRLNERASEILREITGGAYSRIVLDETMEVRIHTPSRVLGLHQVSGGTMQQIYFALRMAASELLGGGVSLPVILDETFAMYDDERLESVLRWLKKSGRQVIVFTCQHREREILKRIQM